MSNRLTAFAVFAVACPVFAQAISGTLGARFTGFGEFGQPNTRVELNLACSLSCPPSAPELTFRSGPVDGHFVVETTQRSGSLSYSFFFCGQDDRHVCGRQHHVHPGVELLPQG